MSTTGAKKKRGLISTVSKEERLKTLLSLKCQLEDLESRIANLKDILNENEHLFTEDPKGNKYREL